MVWLKRNTPISWEFMFNYQKYKVIDNMCQFIVFLHVFNFYQPEIDQTIEFGLQYMSIKNNKLSDKDIEETTYKLYNCKYDIFAH